MLFLPELTFRSLRLRFPLGEAAIWRFWRAFLANDRGDTMDSAAALIDDPALAIWAVLQLREGGTAVADAETVARWLAGRVREVLGGIQLAPDLPSKALSGLLAQCYVLASDCQPPEEAPCPNLRNDLTLAAYLRHTADWLRLAAENTPIANEFSAAFSAAELGFTHAALIDSRIDALRARQMLRRERKARLGRNAALAQQEALRRWNQPPDWQSLTALLLGRMDRSAALEAEFAARLHVEKMASLAEFAAAAGHEINNPLAVISGRAQLLLKHEPQIERRRELARIDAQANRIYEMISGLMLFARPPAPRPESVDLAALLAEVVSQAQSSTDRLQAQITLDIPAGADLQVQADRTQLAVLFKSLLDNALTAAGAGGTIHVAAEALKAVATAGCPHISAVRVPAVRVTVADDGPGITPEVRRHMFDPFYSGRQAGRGMGLGLCKCWRIVQLHGGAIAVDSAPGKGACFTVTLPQVFAADAGAADAVPACATAVGS